MPTFIHSFLHLLIGTLPSCDLPSKYDTWQTTTTTNDSHSTTTTSMPAATITTTATTTTPMTTKKPKEKKKTCSLYKSFDSFRILHFSIFPFPLFSLSLLLCCLPPSPHSSFFFSFLFFRFDNYANSGDMNVTTVVPPSFVLISFYSLPLRRGRKAEQT